MYYNPYLNENTKITCFVYKNKVYQAGTKVLFDGPCILNETDVFLDNIIVVYMYNNRGYSYFEYNNNIYMCRWENFEKSIVQIVIDDHKLTANDKKEFYWTDDMVTKTIWYILIMLVAIIFNNRIGIWIFATIVWYISVFKKK